MFKLLTNSVNLAKEYISKKVAQGSVVIDATAGNGKDTLFLANLVGDSGKVYAFDVQERALNNCLELLKKNEVEHRVNLILDSHHNLGRYIAEGVDGVMFNLGYLPGSDHDIVTNSWTTITALEKALKVLKPGGLISIVVYYGHPGGEEERALIEDYVQRLEQKQFGVVKIDFPNRINNSPFLILVEKEAGGINYEG